MKQRIVFLDFVRVFACFLVILVHASENYYAAPEPGQMAGPMSWLANETDRLWVSIYDGFSRMAVPLFIIVSAYLLVPMPSNETMWQYYRRRFMRVIPPFIIFMVLYAFLPLLWGGTSSDQAFRDFVKIPLNFPMQAGHLWFMYPLISIYLITPMISPWLAKSKPREEQFFIGVFLLSTCMPYLRYFFGELWGECFWNEYHMLWYFSGFLGYVVIAHYIRVHLRWSTSKRIGVGAILLVAGAIPTILTFYAQAVPQTLISTPQLEIGWVFCSINCVALTTGAFLIFSCIKLPATPPAMLSMSRLSYSIYLMHIFWLGVWVLLFKTTLELATVLAIPAIAVGTFLSCWATAKLISFLPGSQWLGVDKNR